MYIGTQVSLISFHRFGVTRILDTLQETCGVNAIRLHADTRVASTAAYHNLQGEAPHLNVCGLPLNPENYHGVPVRSQPYMGAVAPRVRLALLEELRQELEARGMQLQVRHIVGADTERESFSAVLTMDHQGTIGKRPCWNNPHFRGFLRGVAEDVFRTAPIRVDGYLHMAEYSGANTIAGGHSGHTCFCVYCCQRAAQEGIDARRAREGYRLLAQAVRQSESQTQALTLTHSYRLYMQYPEILAWDRMQWDAFHEGPALVRGIALHCNPKAQVGVHVLHTASWNYLQQAGYNYARMAEYADFVKPLMYTTLSGLRASGAVKSFRTQCVPAASFSEAAAIWLRLHGYNPQAHTAFLQNEGDLDPSDYVGTEVRRIRSELGPAFPLYANVGWHQEWEKPPQDPRASATYLSVMAAIASGANGIFLSRAFCPDATYGTVAHPEDPLANSAGGALQKIEGDVGRNSLALYACALRDAGWIR